MYVCIDNKKSRKTTTTNVFKATEKVCNISNTTTVSTLVATLLLQPQSPLQPQHPACTHTYCIIITTNTYIHTCTHSSWLRLPSGCWLPVSDTGNICAPLAYCHSFRLVGWLAARMTSFCLQIKFSNNFYAPRFLYHHITDVVHTRSFHPRTPP